MPVYKNKDSNTWRVVYRYVDFTGKTVQTQKRGFRTKREALAWERENHLKKKADVDMTFDSFLECYVEDLSQRIKENTWGMKTNVIDTKIRPYFGKKKLSEITARDVLQWQNVMRNERKTNGEPYSPVYLKTIHNQLSAIFNHAVKYYGLTENPAAKVGNMGKAKNKEMEIWTKEEYLKFIDVMMDKPMSYYAFEMLYWSGIRVGELQALTPADFDFVKGTVTISKSYQRLNGRDVITTPKTEKSNRVIQLPEFLLREVQDLIRMSYGIERNDRLFQVTRHELHSEMTRGAKEAGVRRIRIHDLRHSHVSLLIDLGYSVLAIADRVGHESTEITYRYAHLFPSRQRELADRLDTERIGKAVAQ